MSASVSRYRLPNGQNVTAVVGSPGRKWLHVAFIDCPVRLRRVPLGDRRYMTPMDYAVREACRKMLDAGTRLGITKAARTFLEAHSYPEAFQTVTFRARKCPSQKAEFRDAESAPITTQGRQNVTQTSVCESCKRLFRVTRRNVKFCSRACKQKAYRRRLS